MPLRTLSEHLVHVHSDLTQFLDPDAAACVMTLLGALITTPAHRAPPYWTAAHPSDPRQLPPTYFRMNQRLDLIEVAPALSYLLEADDPAELVGAKWDDFLDNPEEAKRLGEHWMVAAQTQTGFTHTFALRTRKGRTVTVRKHVLPLRDNLTLGFAGWFGFVHVVAKVIKIDALPPRHDRQSA